MDYSFFAVSREKVVEVTRSHSERFDTLAKIVRENGLIYTRLVEILPSASLESILAISQHKTLMTKFLFVDCKKFSSISDAIKNTTQDDILMYITEIHLYGVFKIPAYLAFMHEVSEAHFDQNITYSPKQVILSGLPQRIAFMCAGDEDFVRKIKKYCEVHFKTSVEIKSDGDRTDIIVKEPILKNMDESRRAFKEFFQFVNAKEPVSIFQLAQDIKDADNTQYMLSNIGEHLKATKIEELVEKLGSIPVTVNVQIINNGNMVFGNAVINNAAAIDDDKARVKNWIRQNPPLNREKRTAYYNRYKTANVNVIAENSFAKIVPAIAGCICTKSHGSTFWVYR